MSVLCKPIRCRLPIWTPMTFEVPSKTPAPVRHWKADAGSPMKLEMDEPFPQDPARQLDDVLKSMARAWEGTTARLLAAGKGRAARTRAWVWWCRKWRPASGPPESGSGVIQFVSSDTGLPQITGRYLGQSQGQGCSFGRKPPRSTLHAIHVDISLEELFPEGFDKPRGSSATTCRKFLSRGDADRVCSRRRAA